MKILVIGLLSILLLIQCSDNTTEPITKPVTEINELLKSAGYLENQPQVYSDISLGTESENYTDGKIKYVSQTEKRQLTNKFDEIIAFNSSYADILYPGAIIQGRDLLEDKLTSIGDFKREPITITLQGGESKKVENPSLSSITNGVNDLLKGNVPNVAQMQYTKTELHNQDQAFLQLGLNAKWLPGQLSGKFNKDNSVTKKSIFMYFKQIYYTVSANQLSSGADYFTNDIDINKLSQRIYSGNPACYISSVSYGRIIIVKMTSEESYSTMQSAIEGSYLIANGKASLDKSKFKINCTFDAVVIGGSARGAADAINSGDIDKFNELIASEASYSSSNPGFPIAYTVRYLNDGSPVKLGRSIEYKKQNWVIDNSNMQKFNIFLSGFDIINDGNSFADGKFYYTIKLIDKNNNILKDANNEEAILLLDREDYKKLGNNTTLLVSNRFSGISLPKENNESFTIMVELWDYFSSGSDVKAGAQGYKYTFPWQNITSDWVTMKLIPEKGSYDTQFKFKIEKLD